MKERKREKDYRGQNDGCVDVCDVFDGNLRLQRNMTWKTENPIAVQIQRTSQILLT